MVGLNNRYTELSLFLKQYIADGRLGKIYTARCGWRRRRGIPGKGGWFTTRALSGGGPLIDLGVHFFDLTLFFMGFPAPTSVLAATYDPFITRTDLVTAMPEGTDNAGVKGGICDVEDLATGFVRFENGATVSFEFSWASNIERDTTYFELLGTRGGIKFEDGIVQLYSEFEGRTLTAVPAVKNTSAWGENETAHFLDCILHNKPVMSPPEEAVRMMQIIDAAYKSAASGKPVSIR